MLAEKALTARWRLGDGETLTIALNLGGESVALGEIPPGKIIFEMDGVDAALAKEAFALAAAKLPFRTTSVHRMLG